MTTVRTSEHSTAADYALRLLARVIAALPLSLLTFLGAALGQLGAHLAPTRRRIALRNLELCFPDLDPPARARLLRAHFAATGTAVLESAIAWAGDRRTLAGRLNVIGEDQFRAALNAPEGVLLLGSHQVTLEIAGACLGTIADVDVVQRTGRDAALDRLRNRGRARHFRALIDRDDPRTLLRSLKAGRCVWYAFDQDLRTGPFVPFMGVPAATVDSAARLVRASGALVLFVDHWRLPGRPRWTLRFRTLALATGDLAVDTRHYVAAIEDAVRAHPAQYLWTHRRFKTTPPGAADRYA